MSATERAHVAVIARAAAGDEVNGTLVAGAVRETAPLLGDGAHLAAVTDVLACAAGLGPLEQFMGDPAITDLMVNGDGRVWVERSGEVTDTGIRLAASQTMRLIERIVAPLGLKADRISPSVDARLADGSRFHAVIPPIAVDGPCVTIRRFAVTPHPVTAFATPAVAELLGRGVQRGANLIVSGGTGTGKTTLLNALAAAIPSDERIVTIEDTAELRLVHAHVVRLETRPASAEGAGGFTARQLVRAALRMRPDRIIIGECRGAEALDMVMAMNTGHAGSMSTCHANDPVGALHRLAMLCLFAGASLSFDQALAEVREAVDLVVHVDRLDHAGARGVRDVIAVENGELHRLVSGGLPTGDAAMHKWT